jgi:dienelactone hydrolase
MTDPHAATAERFVRALERSAWREAAELSSLTAPDGASLDDFLARLWTQLTDQLGAVGALSLAAMRPEGAGHAVDLDARFTRSDVTLRVVLDAERRVSGFWVRPPRPRPWSVPSYVDESRFDEVEVTVGTGPALPGTLTRPHAVPAGGAPGVVLVHGSGPADRDERLGPNRPFKELAWGLASRGVAVLRYDKRSHIAPQSLAGGAVTVETEVIVDALTAMAVLRDASHVDARRVAVLGHSLGGALAPGIAHRDGRAAGVALLAPAGARPSTAVLADQLAYLDAVGDAAARLPTVRPLLDALAARTLPADADALGVPAGYWYDLDGRRALDEARALQIPLLALFGGRDYQVSGVDATLWMEALADRPSAATRRFPGLDHLFRPGAGMATPADYLTRPEPVAVEVIELLAAWLQALPPRG